MATWRLRLARRAVSGDDRVCRAHPAPWTRYRPSRATRFMHSCIGTRRGSPAIIGDARNAHVATRNSQRMAMPLCKGHASLEQGVRRCDSHLLASRDFDVSPCCPIVKQTPATGFDHTRLSGRHIQPRRGIGKLLRRSIASQAAGRVHVMRVQPRNAGPRPCTRRPRTMGPCTRSAPSA